MTSFKMTLMMLGMLTVLQWGCVGNEGPDRRALQLATENDKTLYALGHSMGENLKSFILSAEELRIVTAGLLDAANGDEPQIDVPAFIPKIRNLANARLARSAETEEERSKAFLEEAAGEAGATRTPSGLIYVELTKGAGRSPRATEWVNVHYRGTLIDGTEFDSSHQRGEPADFPLNGVIPCWSEGLQLMAVGGTAKLTCPSSIAYGELGRPPKIPPGATLVFEIELLEIRPR